MKSRWIPRCVLVIGAFASIATSRIVELWNLDDDELLPAAVIDQSGSVTYPIRIEIRGPGPYPSLSGLLEASIRFDPRTAPEIPTSVTARIMSITHPEVPFVEDSLPSGDDGVHELTLMIPAWNGCYNDPCAENFELVITRGEIPNPPIYDITGSVAIDASGDGELVSGTSVVVTVGVPR